MSLLQSDVSSCMKQFNMIIWPICLHDNQISNPCATMHYATCAEARKPFPNSTHRMHKVLASLNLITPSLSVGSIKGRIPE